MPINPINPLIPLESRAADIGTTFSNALLNINRLDQIKQGRQEAPIRQRLLEAQTGTAEAAVPTTQAQETSRRLEKIQSLGLGAQQILPDLQAGRTDQVLAKLQSRKEELAAAGIPTNDTDEAIQLAQTNPDELLTRAQQAIDLAAKMQTGGGVQFGGQQTFKDTEGNLFFGTTRRSPETGQVESVLAPISGGVTQPVGQVSLVGAGGLTAAEQVKQKVAIQEQVGGVKILQDVETASKTEAAKLKTQFKLKPQVEAAVSEALSVVKADAALKEEKRSNERAYKVYNTAMAGLSEALGGTETGPFVGLIPAVTENQQIAEGAVAAMAPVLKQVFRAAGEGIFTDKDQELLLQMAPKRTDGPRARVSKLSNIDAIVRSKFGITGQPTQAQPQAQPAQGAAPQIQEGTTATNPNTGQKVIFTNGQWQPAS